MKKILDRISAEVMDAFEQAGYERSFGRTVLSNRPDLCEFQCNGALAAAKQYHKAPFLIADEVAARLAANRMFRSAESAKPGFLNLKVSPEFLAEHLREMAQTADFGFEKTKEPGTIIIDYGGPNVAKPLHVGHLRSAVIGDSIKRICRFAGHEAIGDVHLGDWGLQMGLIITELSKRQPKLPYFDPAYTGEYPKEPPFSIADLEEIYPAASRRSGEDAAYKEAALRATYELQQGRRGYRALLAHILDVSVADLKRNYEKLGVTFELWKGESDAQPYIPYMVDKMKTDGYAYLSDGALVVDVREEDDKKEIPPCIILKSDGASLYNTTDLGTLVWRMQDYHPSRVIYVVDKRQDMYFTQIFRCAKKTGIVPEETELTFIGFGTVNGKDGRPFKTRAGGVMRLETLLEDTYARMYEKIADSASMLPEEIEQTARIVSIAAIKYGDLSNAAGKDYIFDLEKFTSSEGNTGPYILYTIVRMKSILRKYEALGGIPDPAALLPPVSESEHRLMLVLTRFHDALEEACAELAPHKICSFVYDLANECNHFYHETAILKEADKVRRSHYIALLLLAKHMLETCIDLLGFAAPEKM